jgi:hypothetical protein
MVQVTSHQAVGTLFLASSSRAVHPELLKHPMHVHHLSGDAPALFVVAAVLAFLSPQAFRLPFAKRAA